VLAASGVGASHAIRLARQPKTTPYRKAYSCPSANVSSGHVDPTVAKLIADLSPGFAIKVPVYLATLAAVDRRTVLGDLLVALTRIRSP
jgi:hypothetical protein